MLNIKALQPILWTENLEETIAFYTEILGFTVDEKSSEWGWTSLSCGEAKLMLASPNKHENYGGIGFSGSFYFNVEDVGAWWKRLKDRTKICYPIGDFPWEMREFAVYDNNGYILQFGEEIGWK